MGWGTGELGNWGWGGGREGAYAVHVVEEPAIFV